MSDKLYQTIATEILDVLQRGVRPWEACYSISQHSYPLQITGDNYRGINRLTLLNAMLKKGYTNPLWMTFLQAKRLGAQVKRGEKASLSVFFKRIDMEDEDNDDVRTVWVAKANHVFNAEQIDNLPDDLLGKLLKPPQHDNEPSERAETFIANIPATIREHNGTPAFSRTKDEIYLPPITQFTSSEHYYATALHELGHWSGHRDRLNRPTLQDNTPRNYYREELCAELTASFLSPELDIKPLIDDEHAPYLNHYIMLLQDDPKAFVRACSQAERAADYLKGFQEPDL